MLKLCQRCSAWPGIGQLEFVLLSIILGVSQSFIMLRDFSGKVGLLEPRLLWILGGGSFGWVQSLCYSLYEKNY